MNHTTDNYFRALAPYVAKPFFAGAGVFTESANVDGYLCRRYSVT